MEDAFDLGDPGFDLGLTVAGRVVVGVFRKVALAAGEGEGFNDLRADDVDEVAPFGFELIFFGFG